MVEAAYLTGAYEKAETVLREALDLARADGDRRTEAAALDRLGMLTHYQALDRLRTAAAGTATARAGAPDTDTEAEATAVGHAEAIADAEAAAKAAADAEEALFQQALSIRREIGDQGGVAESLFGIGLVHQVLRGDWSAAMPYYWQALELAEEHGDELIRSEVHRHIGFFYMIKEKRPDEGIRHLRISLELRERYGDPRWLPGGTLALGQAEFVAGRRDEAIEHLRLAVAQMREIGLRGGRIEEAEVWLRRAESGQDPPVN